MENRFIQKIPLNPPLPKGEDARKDSRQAGMTDGTKSKCYSNVCIIESHYLG